MQNFQPIDRELNGSLKQKIVDHRENFKYIFKARYKELLPSLIKYRNSETINVDFLKVEIALRNNYDMVIGETVNNKIQVIGYTNSKTSGENPSDLFSTNLLNEQDINFIIPEHLRRSFYKEISNYDDCKTGNFIVLRNKTLNYLNDNILIDHYINELAEIVLSRFSISMQVKISTLFISEVNDESINQLISDIYNGNPFIKASKLFDPNDQIYNMQNDGIAQNFNELKREYQNKISELNNILGINSLAVEKESGVSDSEANGNRGFTSGNANIYLDARNNGLKKLNKRYGLNIEALYNDDVTSEIQELNNEIELNESKGEENDTTHNDTI